mgnify:CR=1 FL=1
MKIMILIRFVFLYSAMTLSFSLEAQERLLVSRIENDFNEDYMERLLTEAYQQIGVKVDYIQYPAKRALYASNLGETDGEMARIEGVDKEFQNLLMTDVTISSIDIVVFTKNEKILVDGWQSLKPYSIAIPRGIRVIENGTAGMEVSAFNTTEKILELVSMGRYDVAVLTRIDGLGYAKKLNITNLTILEPPVAKVDLYHYLHKKHENLLPKINSSLLELKKSGRMKVIRDQFLVELKLD